MMYMTETYEMQPVQLTASFYYMFSPSFSEATPFDDLIIKAKWIQKESSSREIAIMLLLTSTFKMTKWFAALVFHLWTIKASLYCYLPTTTQRQGLPPLKRKQRNPISSSETCESEVKINILSQQRCENQTYESGNGFRKFTVWTVR